MHFHHDIACRERRVTGLTHEGMAAERLSRDHGKRGFSPPKKQAYRLCGCPVQVVGMPLACFKRQAQWEASHPVQLRMLRVPVGKTAHSFFLARTIKPSSSKPNSSTD